MCEPSQAKPADSSSRPATAGHLAPKRSTSQPTIGLATASAIVTSSTPKPNCTRVRPKSRVRPPTNRPLVYSSSADTPVALPTTAPARLLGQPRAGSCVDMLIAPDGVDA